MVVKLITKLPGIIQMHLETLNFSFAPNWFLLSNIFDVGVVDVRTQTKTSKEDSDVVADETNYRYVL